MTQFGPQQPLNKLGLKDRPSAGSYAISDAIASFDPVTGDGVTELANFLVDAGIYYRTNRFFVTVFPPQLPNNTLSNSSR